MKSNQQHQFAQVPKAEIPRSVFDRSFGHKTTFDAGYLIPIVYDEHLPGDSFNVNMTAFARLATPLYPLMDNLYMDIHFFSVPNRIIWDNWQRMCGEQTTPGDSIDYSTPIITQPGGGFVENTLPDYFSLPIGKPNVDVCALHFRAYNRIWNDWYRDQNMQNPVTINTGNGPDASTDYTLLKRGKRHDYFTSCLPWPQKGIAVSVPLGAGADIKYNTFGAGTSHADQFVIASVDGSGISQFEFANNGAGSGRNLLGNNSWAPMYADLQNATAATINTLRQAFQIQKLLERDARGGTRYTEILKAHFGVTSPDARLQRPEYLGGTSSPLRIMPVASTNYNATYPQGHLAGFGTITAQCNWTKSFVEHGVIIGLVSVRADLSYQQGMSRMWSRRTRYDFYWPGLAHIGEQAVLNKEIYTQSNPTVDNAAFGYQERWAEYRYNPSRITARFRSSATATLDAWHLAQNFGSLPTLSDTFIKETPPMSRVIAVNTEPHFLFDSHIEMRCARPMPVYSVPGLIDHF